MNEFDKNMNDYVFKIRDALRIAEVQCRKKWNSSLYINDDELSYKTYIEARSELKIIHNINKRLDEFETEFNFKEDTSETLNTNRRTITINIGDYLEMGTYYNHPILWRCVDIDKNGPLMLSDKIICLKPFDAAGTKTTGSHGRTYNNGEFRKKYGSNCWSDSNIRSWLNSSAKPMNVIWLCGNSPKSNRVSCNAYIGEAGFKTNFTSQELTIVKSVMHDSLLSENEYEDMSVYGEKPHENQRDITNVIQNAKTNAYKEQVIDEFFCSM